jgi:hypothetical protein
MNGFTKNTPDRRNSPEMKIISQTPERCSAPLSQVAGEGAGAPAKVPQS